MRIPVAFLGLVTCILAAQQAPPSTDAEVEAALLELLNTPINVGTTRAVGILAAPSTVTIMDRETMRRFGFRTVQEVLEQVAGLEVKRTYLKRDVLTIRGILQDNYASKVLLLLDGVPVWHGSTGEAVPYRIDLDEVERVEVMRGPGSVVYGSNAFVGAVNLVLRKQDGHEVRGALASHGGSRAGFTSRVEHGAWRMFVAAGTSTIEGPERPFTDEKGTTRPFTDFERVKTATASLSLGGHRLLFNAYRADEGYLGNTPLWPNPSAVPVVPGDGIGYPHRTSGRLFAYTFDQVLSGSWTLKGGASLDWEDRNLSRRGDDTRRSNIEGERTSVFLRGLYKAAPWLNVEMGADYERRKSIEYTDMNPSSGQLFNDFSMRGVSVSERSAFLQGTLDAAPFHLLLGSRYTRNELAGSNTSSRLTAVYELNPRSSLKFIAGQSFRAPTLFELYFTSGTTVLGNKQLLPERAESIELAYLTAIKGWFLQGLVYTATYRDKIMRVTVPGSAATKYANGGAFKGSGVELEAKYQGSGVEAFIALDALLHTDRGDENPIGSGHANFRYTPRQHLTAGVARIIGAWTLALNGTYESRAEGYTAPIPSQGTVSAKASFVHSLGKVQLDHQLRLQNAGDRELLTAEFVRHRGVNAVPLDGYGRSLEYTLRASF